MRLEEKTRDKIYKIARNYDTEAQVDVLIEEMAELTKALLKNRRAQSGNTDEKIGHTVQDIIEEMADVQIMLLQISFLGDFGDDVIDVMDYKLDRQLERIQNQK
jgi:NTP pyrophosphatase (non-canonical NTP hydrolase)